MSAAHSVELLEKNKPQQERAKRTYEAILASAAKLLVEVGVERISTNLIAEDAGITVPALYRYFPNKYAVLNALGAVLMDRQNAASQQWHSCRDWDFRSTVSGIDSPWTYCEMIIGRCTSVLQYPMTVFNSDPGRDGEVELDFEYIPIAVLFVSCVKVTG